ncbi:MAG: sugar ABC transporter substrate-binding protein [Chloroflexi bacterium]|nr:sugar ABC transporter substrate-binding protein [Chloroflexota bacterium]
MKLTYFTFSAAPDYLTELDSIVKAFEAKYPNITIEVQTASYDQYFTKLQTAVSGGTAPDTFELNYENFVTYASAGSLLDISSQAQAAASTYYPRAYAVFQQDGKQYGLPESFSDVLLFYNKDLFDAANQAYPTADWTWADELAAAKKLTNAGSGVWGDFQPVQFFEFYKVLAQNGGTFFNADQTASTFNDAKGVEAANWLIRKANTDKVMPTAAQLGGQDDTALFKSGKLAMWHNGIWQFSGLKDTTFKWDVQVEPGNTVKANHFFANAVVASAKTAQPAEAYQWLAFLTGSAEAVKIRLDASWELPAVADQSQFASYLSQTPPDNRKAVFDALSDIVVPPVIEQESQLQDIVTKALQAAQTGQKTVQEALDGAAQQVDALLK